MEVILYALLGLIVLFVPGFLLTLILYPRREQLDFWQRVAVSFGLSVLVLIYIGLVLAQPGLKLLSSGPFFGAVFVVCLFFALLARLQGGFEVLASYWRAVAPAFHRLKPPRPAQPEVKPPEEKPPEAQIPEEKPPEEAKPKEVPEEEAPEESRPEREMGSHEASADL